MSLSLHTAPTTMPLTVAEARDAQRVDGDGDNWMIDLAIRQSVEDAEAIMKRAIMPQKWQRTLDAFPGGCIKLQRPKVTAIDSITYTGTDGSQVALDPSAWQLAAASDVTAEVWPAYATSWPAARAQPEAVRVVFTCGYANAAAVPASIKAWIILRVGALLENRSAWQAGRQIELNPQLDHLLDRYCANTF